MISPIQSKVRAAGVGISALFNKSYHALTAANAPRLIDKLCMKVDSKGAGEDHVDLGDLPQMEERLSGIRIKDLFPQGFTIANKTYDAVIGIKEEHLEDDKLGLYTAKVAGLAQVAYNYPDVKLIALILAGFAEVCYDGQFFFDTDHTSGENTTSQSNSLGVGSSGSATVTAFGTSNYGLCRAKMRRFKNDRNKAMNIVPSLILLPPELEKTGRDVLNAGTISTAGENVWKSSAELAISNELTSTADWFAFDVGKAVKPFIYQDRKKPYVQYLGFGTTEQFNEGRHLFKVSMRFGLGYGAWFLAAGMDVA